MKVYSCNWPSPDHNTHFNQDGEDVQNVNFIAFFGIRSKAPVLATATEHKNVAMRPMCDQRSVSKH